ncbi:hypothetical protein [Ekhidna sp.]|uniref:hypothetical protein n=1 Tax=Ekhidna sp. TaxID=2608089 RepID=UPI003B5A6885
MKYLIVGENSLCIQLSDTLSDEIERFDIRSAIKKAIPQEATSLLKSFEPDLLIVVGTNRSNSLLVKARRRGVKSCFFHQTLLDDRNTFIQPTSGQKVFYDIPRSSKSSNHAFLLLDRIRNHDNYSSHENIKPKVSIIYSEAAEEKRARKLSKKLSGHSNDIIYELLNISADLPEAIDASIHSNSAISLDRFSNLFAAYTNCPTVNVYRNSLFKKANNRVSPLNKLTNNEVVKDISGNNIELIIEEISRILNDHQYCAGIMQSYQEIKDIVGTHPFARQAVREIVDWMEEED